MLLIVTLFVLVISLTSLNSNEYYTSPKLPISGSEPNYYPKAWNADNDLLISHNCYAYFLDDIDTARTKKPQPGYYSIGKENINEDSENKYSSCEVMEDRILKDNPGIYKAQESEQCRSGYYKGFLTWHPGKDYHFYRQDSNGLFSHKRGKKKVSNIDSNGELIANPRLAAKNYSSYNYTTNCNYFCIPSNKRAVTNSTA